MYTQVKNPKWANAEHTAINCEVNFDHLPDEFVPFTACKEDVMPYSKIIFEDCLNGNNGEIAEYVEPPPPPILPKPTKEDLQAQLLSIQAQLDALK